MLNTENAPRQGGMKQKARRVLIAGALATSALLMATPAHADDTVILRNWETGLCLDSNHAGEVYAIGCNGGQYQVWNFKNDFWATTDIIKDAATGRCLDSNGAGKVYTLPCNGGPYQSWYTSQNPGHVWRLKNKATGLMLDSNRAGAVYTLAANGGGNQNWSPKY
ncbi:ricin-type beta-trefoil lectin domain protein [Streptosporangium sp. NPDC051022]|uniref:RICIN domain-containing protein n=1 Tax=Streptosporangium sp. NPDC051022 TaxID=3155752 RepID=UPI0034453890